MEDINQKNMRKIISNKEIIGKECTKKQIYTEGKIKSANKYQDKDFFFRDFSRFYPMILQDIQGIEKEIPADGAAAVELFDKVFGVKYYSADLEGFEYVSEDQQTTVKCQVTAEREKGKRTYYYTFVFTRNNELIYKTRRAADGGSDIVARIFCGKEKEAFYAVLILCLAVRYHITDYTLIETNETVPLCWTSAAEFLHTAAILENKLCLQHMLQKDKHPKHLPKLHFRNYLNRKFDPAVLEEHLLKWSKDGAKGDIIEKRNWKIEIDASIQQSLIKFKETNNKLSMLNKYIAEEILLRAERFPLMSEILEIKTGDEEEILNVVNLLKQICRVDIKQKERGGIRLDVGSVHYAEAAVRIEPVIGSAFRHFDDVYDVFLAKNYRTYTKQNVVLFFAFLARKLSDKPDHSCTAAEMKKYCRAYAKESGEIDDDTAVQIWKDAEKHNFIIIQADNRRKFQHKELRLIFLGIYEGMIENQRQSGGSSEMDEKIPFANAVRFLAMTDEDHNEKTPEHYKWKFDNTSIFGCTFLNTLTYQKRVELLEELCGLAADASKENRKQQERTIALLSYYLCEGTEITGKWQEKLFYAAYSRDLYPIQETMWEYLRVSCPFYKKRIAGALRDACTFDKDKQFSKESPYYILLGWDRRNQPGKEEQIFLWESCRYKHHSWFGNPKEGWDYEDAFRKIKAAVKKLKNIKELRDEVLAYVYSLDLLLLAISNVKGRPSDAHYLMEKDVRNLIIDEREVFLEAVVLGDYYTRRFNRVYNQKDPQSWKNELFLLSGPIRFLCMYYDLFAGTKINLSETRWKAYQGWYCNKEFGRWKVLLTRLLSFTDFFDSPAVKALNKAEYNSSDFLEYDNLPDLYDEFMKQCSIKCSD